MVDLDKIKACPECGSEDIVHSEKNQAIICKTCGAEFSELAPDDEKKFEDASDVI